MWEMVSPDSYFINLSRCAGHAFLQEVKQESTESATQLRLKQGFNPFLSRHVHGERGISTEIRKVMGLIPTLALALQMFATLGLHKGSF